MDCQMLQAATALARHNSDYSIAALAELVRIPSMTGEEGAAQRHVARLLRDIGAEVSEVEPDIDALFQAFPEVAQYPTHWRHDLILPYAELPTLADLNASGLRNVLNYKDRPNVVGVVKGSGGGRSLILNGHIDTVTIEPREAWTCDPFGADIVDGRMYGRGTSDMKGGLMAAIMAMRYLREAGVQLAGDVIIQSVVNEEHAGNGTLDLVRRGIRADAAIVLEPTENRIFVSHPGGLYWQVDVRGVQRSPGARWCGQMQEGVSAIERLPGVVHALLDIEREYNSTCADDLLGAGPAAFSLIMGRIAGGHYETATASDVRIKGGAYFSPNVGSFRDVMRRFRDAIAGVNCDDRYHGCDPISVSFLHHDDATRQMPDIAIARQLGATLAHSGGDCCAGHGPFCCDMRHLVNQGGIPSVIFGPGSIAEAHKPNEYIGIASYLAAIGHLIEFISLWCNTQREAQ